MTYNILEYNLEPLQEGNVAELLDIELDANFPISQVSDITCVFRHVKTRQTIFTKKHSEGTISKDTSGALPIIIVSLLSTDTIGFSGECKYELDFINLGNKPFATMKGLVKVEPQINNS